MADSQRLIVRCKPCTSEEKPLETSTLFTDDIQYDQLHGGDVKHEEFFQKSVADWVGDILNGSSLSILVYGPSCSGKSFTIFGNPGETRTNHSARGIIVRCFEEINNRLQMQPRNKLALVKGSFYHITNDGQIADLIDARKRKLQIKLQSTGSYSVTDASQHTLTSIQDVVKLIEKAILMRNVTGVVRKEKKTGTPLAFNNTSGNPLKDYRPHSSHAVFQYTIETCTNDDSHDNNTTISTLTIIDLAGDQISNYHTNSSCTDHNVTALHDTLNALSCTDDTNASELCLTSPLTQLLYSCLFGNTRCILINTLLMEPSNESLVKKCLRVCSNIRHVKTKAITQSSTSSKPTESSLNIILTQINNYKKEILQELGKDSQNELLLQSLEILNNEVKINGETIDQTSHNIKAISELESQLLPSKNKVETQTYRKPPLPIIPLTANTPQKPLPQLAVINRIPPPHISLPHSATYPSPLPTPVISRQVSKDIVSSDEESSSSDSEVEDKDPPTTGDTASPPPLKDIPHILPPTSPTRQSIDTPFSHSESTVSSSNKNNYLQKNINTSQQQIDHNITAQFNSTHKRDFSFARLPPLPNSTTVPSFNNNNKITSLNNTKTTSNNKDNEITLNNNNTNGTLIANTSNAPTNDDETKTSHDNMKTTLSTSLRDDAKTKTIPMSFPSNAPIVPNHNNNNNSTKIVPLVPKHVSSSSSSSSPQPASHHVITPQEIQRKKKSKKRTRARSLTPTSSPVKQLPNAKVFLSSTSEEEDSLNEDKFDPSFKPKKLSFNPQRMQPNRDFSNAFQLQQQSATPSLVSPSPALPPLLPPFHSLSPPLPSQYSTSPLSPSFLPPLSPPSLSNPSTNNRPILPPYKENKHATPGNTHDSIVVHQSDTRTSVDISQGLSNHELHQAVLYGAKASDIKKLVMKYGIDYRDEGGRTALMYSVLGNHPKLTEFLISLGAEIDAVDSTHLTALFWAVYQAKSEVIKTLLKNGANIYVTDPQLRTVFHWVMRTPNVSCIKVLCKFAYGDIQNKADYEGLTPLHWAVMCEQSQHIKTLIASLPSTDVCAQDSKGRTPLNYAALIYSPICIKAILDSRPDSITFKDSKGRTALHYACADGSVDCVRALLTCKNCDLHCIDNFGTTPLHWAAVTNQTGIVQLLLRRGADRGQTDHKDMTPLDHARQRNHSECVRLLENYGLQRQASSWSIASQFSIHPPTPPELDEHGHIPMKRLTSTSHDDSQLAPFPTTAALTVNDPKHSEIKGTVVARENEIPNTVVATSTSQDRLPADGHSNTEIPTGESAAGLLSSDDNKTDSITDLHDDTSSIGPLQNVPTTTQRTNWKRRLRSILLPCVSNTAIVPANNEE